MGYKSSPRPEFDKPTKIAYDDVTRHLWGEPEAGQVDDWIYASTDKIHQLVFGQAPSGLNQTYGTHRIAFPVSSAGMCAPAMQRIVKRA